MGVSLQKVTKKKEVQRCSSKQVKGLIKKRSSDCSKPYKPQRGGCAGGRKQGAEGGCEETRGEVEERSLITVQTHREQQSCSFNQNLETKSFTFLSQPDFFLLR